MSDSDKPEDEKAQASRPGDAEPVDAEFEPAPDASAEPSKDKPKRSGGAGGLKVFLFVVLAASIGGATGYGLSRYLPALSGPAASGPGAQTAALEARIVALESQSAPDLAGLTERVSRLESVTQAREGLSSRVDTLAASLNRLEREIASGASAAGDGAQGEGSSDGQAGGQAASGPALAALETRINDAFNEVQDRLDALAGDVETARSEADAARSAAQQANAAIGGLSTGQSETGAPSDQRLAALSGRIDALAEQVSGLPVAAPADAASQQAVDAIQTRLRTLAEDVSELSGRVAALESASPPRDTGAQSTSEPVDLAARALAFAALTEAASGSQAFAVELEALARAWPGAPGLSDLRSVAREGAPTPDRLSETFPAEALSEATGEMRTYFGVLRVAREQNEGPAAAIEQALAEDDLSEAARIVAALDAPGLAAVEGWRAGLAARLRVRETLSEQSAALAAAGDRE